VHRQAVEPNPGLDGYFQIITKIQPVVSGEHPDEFPGEFASLCS
jgi:hypothetical protein